MRDRPLLIYLDTSDFSVLADAAAGREDKAAFVPVLDALEGRIRSGDVIVVYSAVTLSELLQFKDGGRDLTMRKAALVERLCGQNA